MGNEQQSWPPELGRLLLIRKFSGAPYPRSFRNGCQWKKQYPGRDIAEERLARAQTRWNWRGNCVTYQCRWCRFWHIGGAIG